MTKQITGSPTRLSTLILVPALAACAGTGMAGADTPGPDGSESAVHAAVETITAEDVARRIGVLAHDSMAGRDTPSPELEQAAEYLADEFRAMGLTPAGDDGSFLDRWDYEVTRLATDETLLGVEGDESVALEYGVDFFLVPGMQQPAATEAVYAGVAGEASGSPDLQGKLVVVDHPGEEPNQEWQQAIMAGLQPAMMSGAAGLVLILDPAFPQDMVSQIADATAQQQAPFPVVWVTTDAAERLAEAAGGDLAAARSADGPTPLGDAALELSWGRTTETHRPPNVAAMLPGSDTALEDTYVVITAHFDHVGTGTPDESGDSIFNGADDNASGTAAVVEIAEAFASLPEAPARSVIFLAVSGEEKGLLGAMAYTENPPVIDISNVVANVNLDMISRNAPDTVIGIGQEYTTLQGVLDTIQAHHPELGLSVILDPKPEENFFFRSDQLAFVQQGIPALFFTTLDHEDYHKPSDEPEKSNADKAARVAKLSFLVAYHVAQDRVAPEWTEEGKRQVEGMLQGSPF